jgi:hypothetical protein
VSGWLFLSIVQTSFFAGMASSVHAQRLTEFLAINTLGKKDEDGTPQPWVEIWNQAEQWHGYLVDPYHPDHAGRADYHLGFREKP